MEICVSKSIGSALNLEVNLPGWFCFTVYFRAKYKLHGALYLEGRFNGRFLALPLFFLGGGGREAYIWRGLYMEELIFGMFRQYTNIFLTANKKKNRGKEGVKKWKINP